MVIFPNAIPSAITMEFISMRHTGAFTPERMALR
jgi:hypothetical protein